MGKYHKQVNTSIITGWLRAGKELSRLEGEKVMGVVEEGLPESVGAKGEKESAGTRAGGGGQCALQLSKRRCGFGVRTQTLAHSV